MKAAASILIALGLTACSSQQGNLTPPALSTPPDIPGAYYDQNLPAPHFVDRRPHTVVEYEALPPRDAGHPPRNRHTSTCAPDISAAVCEDWMRHRSGK